ncbi:hypothetical protein KJ781_00450 [Patescibacteria group bacterium]|nr:hypothetical protein [Patescibacteria group bacterium]MBU1448446.1 hypothetical protein [Patescibacteria group bacterium]MBU2612882.1 hypothetical protein [Patescibacteria group bacterium]
MSVLSIMILGSVIGCVSEPEADSLQQTSTTTTPTGGSGGEAGSTQTGGSGGSGGDVGGSTATGGSGGSGGASCPDAEGTVRFRWSKPDGYDLAGGAIRVCGEYALPGGDPVSHWDCSGTVPNVTGFCQMQPVGGGVYECTADVPVAALVTYTIYIGGNPDAYAFDYCEWPGGGYGETFGTPEVEHQCALLEVDPEDNESDAYLCTMNGLFTVPGEL